MHPTWKRWRLLPPRRWTSGPFLFPARCRLQRWKRPDSDGARYFTMYTIIKDWVRFCQKVTAYLVLKCVLRQHRVLLGGEEGGTRCRLGIRRGRDRHREGTHLKPTTLPLALGKTVLLLNLASLSATWSSWTFLLRYQGRSRRGDLIDLMGKNEEGELTAAQDSWHLDRRPRDLNIEPLVLCCQSTMKLSGVLNYNSERWNVSLYLLFLFCLHFIFVRLIAPVCQLPCKCMPWGSRVESI